MPRITRTVVLKASPEVIVEYIANVENHPAFISALKSVDNLTGDPKQVGAGWNWKFVMSGVEFDGNAETASYVADQQFSFKTTGGIKSTFSYTVKPEGDGSRLTMDIDYTVPDNAIAKALDKAVIERVNEQEADSAIENLKTILNV